MRNAISGRGSDRGLGPDAAVWIGDDGTVSAAGVPLHPIKVRRPPHARFLIVALTLSTLVGCSTFNDLFGSGSSATGTPAASRTTPAPRTVSRTDLDPSPANSIPNRVQQLEQKVASLQAEIDRIGPGLERLTSMENDLRTLVALVRRPDGRPGAGPTLLNLGTAPGQGPIPQSASVATKDQFSVHLASFKDEDTARKGWKDLSGKYADLLGSLDYRISPVKLAGDKGPFQRLKAGPFTDSASANEVCKVLKARKAYCTVAHFSGSK